MPQNDQTSEWKHAQEIIHLHDNLGMGFRRVAKELTSQGWKVNKDGANKIYNLYKPVTSDEVKDTKELMRLKLAETRERQRLEIKKEKEEIRNRLSISFVENATMTFEQRKLLFTDRKRLLRFAGKTMPEVDPLLWDQFQDHCHEEKIRLAAAVSTALGRQADYEVQTREDADGRQRFDLYLQQRLKAALQRWTMPDQEESQIQEEPDSTFTEGENEEYVTIESPFEGSSY